MAVKYLSLNKNNRPVTQSTVDAYALSMKRGEWLVNGETIIFDDTGCLTNGQHRLLAVVKTGIPLDVLVVRGVSKQAFKTMDSGRKRTSGDVLAIAGEINANRLAAAARSYIQYITGYTRDVKAISSTTVQDFVNIHPELRYWVSRFCNHKNTKRCPSTMIAYLTIASEKYGIQKLDDFLDKFQTGANLDVNEPAFLLRERLFNQSDVKRLSPQMTSAFIIKSINLHIAGKRAAFLRHKLEDEFPKIV